MYRNIAKGVPVIKGQRFLRMFSTGYELPNPLPWGTILTSSNEREWKLGKCIAVNSFGGVYLASNDLKREPTLDARYAIKFERYGWFTKEYYFYKCVCLPERISEWMKTKQLSFLGIPRYIDHGSPKINKSSYEFVVMERYGENLEKLLVQHNGVLPANVVFTVGNLVLDVLEYTHSYGRLHCDINASNLVTGYGPGREDEVYLIDFGDTCYFINSGQHMQTRPFRANEGSIQFRSRDSHIGATTRRGDLESLGYNMLRWLCGHLPWDNDLNDLAYVHFQKRKYVSNLGISALMKRCFQGEKPPRGLAEYFTYIVDLKLEEKPDYNHCKSILSETIKAEVK